MNALLTEPQVVALDVSDLVLRAVTLDGARRPKLTAYQELLLPAGLIVDGEIVDPREVSQRLRTLLDHAAPHRIRRTAALASLPDRRTFVKLVPLDHQPRRAEAVASLIREQLPQHFPFLLEDVYLDWQVVTSDDGHAFALVGAAPRTLVDRYAETLRLAGLLPYGFEMESLAVARAVLPPAPTEAVLVVDLGGTRTTAVVVAQGLVQFASSLPHSGGAFTQAVADTLHVSLADAEKLKVLYGLTRGRAHGAVARALRSPLNDLTQALQDLLRYYANHFPEPAALTHALLTGGGSQLSGLTGALAESLNLTVTIGDPGRHLRPPLGLPETRLPSFTTAIGIAVPSYGSFEPARPS